MRKVKDVTYTIPPLARLLSTKYKNAYFLHFGQAIEKDYHSFYLGQLADITAQEPGLGHRMKFVG